MLRLAPVDYLVLSKYFQDFQKKSRCFELPPEESQCVGIYEDTTLIGYFIVVCYDDLSAEINQGYLLPKYRHSGLPTKCTTLLEELCRKNGYKKMLLGTHNRFKSYLKFARQLGYKPTHLVFEKSLI